MEMMPSAVQRVRQVRRPSPVSSSLHLSRLGPQRELIMQKRPPMRIETDDRLFFLGEGMVSQDAKWTRANGLRVIFVRFSSRLASLKLSLQSTQIRESMLSWDMKSRSKSSLCSESPLTLM